MAQNADNQDDKSSGNDKSTKVTEEDLRKLKYGDDGVDGSTDEDDQDDTTEDDESGDDTAETGDDDGKTDDETEDDDSEEEDDTDSADDDSEFVKQFPNIKGDTLVDYARNLEETISKSNTEGKRLFDENESLKQENARLKTGKGSSGDKSGKSDDKGGDENLTTDQLYVRQKQNEEIDAAFGEFRKDYPQVEDTAEYNKFVAEVRILGQTIYASQKRLAPPKELYSKAAAILGWEANKVDNKDRLKVALKDRAAVSKPSSSATGKKAPKSKVTEAMIRANLKMYPNKSRDDIIKELEPHVQ